MQFHMKRGKTNRYYKYSKKLSGSIYPGNKNRPIAHLMSDTCGPFSSNFASKHLHSSSIIPYFDNILSLPQIVFTKSFGCEQRRYW